jgi:hypothetical protein
MFTIFQGLMKRSQKPSDRREAERYSDGSKAEIELFGNRHLPGRVLDVSQTGVRFLCLGALSVGRTVVARVDLVNGCTHLPLRIVWSARKGQVWEYGAVPDVNRPVAATLLRTYASRFARVLGAAA